jgi:hypothetical protein
MGTSCRHTRRARDVLENGKNAPRGHDDRSWRVKSTRPGEQGTVNLVGIVHATALPAMGLVPVQAISQAARTSGAPPSVVAYASAKTVTAATHRVLPAKLHSSPALRG